MLAQWYPTISGSFRQPGGHRASLREPCRCRRRARSDNDAHASSTSPSTSKCKSTPPIVNAALAGSASSPLILPLATASRTARSISRCAVTPTFLRNFRTLVLRMSSFMVASLRSWSLFLVRCDGDGTRNAQRVLTKRTSDLEQDCHDCESEANDGTLERARQAVRARDGERRARAQAASLLVPG